MDKYWHYWKQGWKSQLAMLIFNICVSLVLVPVPLYLGLGKHGYYAIAIPVYVMFLVPVGGYLYCMLKPNMVNESDDGAND
jgi:hypothetical protein